MTTLHKLPSHAPSLSRRTGSGSLTIRGVVAWSTVGAAALVALLAIAQLTTWNPIYALLAAIVLLLAGICLWQPLLLPALAMPLFVVVERVGGESINLSLSDLALFGTFWLALLFTPGPMNKPMRALLWLSFTYQVATLFTVIAQVYSENTVEWFHAWLSIGGALVVGWSVGRAGHARLGITLFMVPCVLIAALTCATAAVQLAAGHTEAVYLDWPFAMHKNFIGGILAFAALVAYTRPVWLRWSTPVALSVFALCTLGVFASQARQAVIGLGVALAVVALRPDPDRKRSKVILLGIVPAALFVVSMVRDQLESGNRFNSTYQRLAWYEDALTVWRQNEWFGVGLRWWEAGRTDFAFQPPNAELEVLSSAGTVGLVGFLVLMVGTLVVLWRVDPRYGTLAFAIIAMRLVQAQFDLFWVAIQTSVPFVIAGVCIGAMAYERATTNAEPPAERRRAVPMSAGIRP